MVFNKHGNLARFYLWFEQDRDKARLPDDFCTYFWGLVGRCIALAFLVFCLAGLVAGAGYIVYFGALLVWANLRDVGLILAPFLVALVFLLWDHHRKGKKVEFVEEIKEVIRGRVDSVKDRYCPRIEWVDGGKSD